MLSSLIKRRNESEPTEIVASEPCPLEPGSVGLLKAIDIFRDLPQDAVEALMDRTSMSTAKRGAVFYGGDEGPEVLFLLKSGKVELYRRSRDGKRLTLGIVEQGAFFGEMSLVGQRLVGNLRRRRRGQRGLRAYPPRGRGAYGEAPSGGAEGDRGAGSQAAAGQRRPPGDDLQRRDRQGRFAAAPSRRSRYHRYRGVLPSGPGLHGWVPAGELYGGARPLEGRPGSSTSPENGSRSATAPSSRGS